MAWKEPFVGNRKHRVRKTFRFILEDCYLQNMSGTSVLRQQCFKSLPFLNRQANENFLDEKENRLKNQLLSCIMKTFHRIWKQKRDWRNRIQGRNLKKKWALTKKYTPSLNDTQVEKTLGRQGELGKMFKKTSVFTFFKAVCINRTFQRRKWPRNKDFELLNVFTSSSKNYETTYYCPCLVFLFLEKKKKSSL